MGIVTRVREALKRAQGDADALQAKVSYWSGIIEAKRAELAELEAGVGRRVADDDTGKALQEYAGAKYGLSAQIEGARGALEEFEGRLRAATWALKSAQAAELRERAAAVRAEAETLQARVDELKQALEDVAGGDWRPWRPTSDDVLSAGAAGIKLPPLKAPPLFAEAARLDAEAAQLEEQVATEQRQAEQLAPHARITWDGRHQRGNWTVVVEAGVNDGTGGSMTFEVLRRGEVVHTRVLPEPGGRRGFRQLVNGFHGNTVEVRANGLVIASQRIEVPAGEVNLSHPVGIR